MLMLHHAEQAVVLIRVQLNVTKVELESVKGDSGVQRGVSPSMPLRLARRNSPERPLWSRAVASSSRTARGSRPGRTRSDKGYSKSVEYTNTF